MSWSKRSICHWCVRVNCQIEDDKGTQMMLLLFSCWLPCISYMQWKVQYFFKYEPMHVCSMYIHSYSGTWCTAQVLYSRGGWWQLDGVFSVLGAVWPSKVHDIQSWYTCVERYYTVLDIFQKQHEKKSKNFVTEMEKRMSCLPQFQEIRRVLKGGDHLCVKDLCEFISPCMNQGSHEKIDPSQNVFGILPCWHFFGPGLIPFTLVPVFACKIHALLTKHLTIPQLQVQVYFQYSKCTVSYTCMQAHVWFNGSSVAIGNQVG